MTEEEAKAKGCPWAVVHSQSAINRTPGGAYHPGALCQGSKCMAWDWLNPNEDDGDCRRCRQNNGN